MSITYLSEKALRLLEVLATYKYLTTSQFMALSLFKYRSQAYPLYKNLISGKYAQTLGSEKKPKVLIQKQSFGVDPKLGKLEDIYFLTQQGVNYLVEHLDKNVEDIKYPKNLNSLFARDYFHRKYCIDFYIYLKQESDKRDFSIELFYYYFDKVGSTKGIIPLQSKTQIGEDPNNFLVSDTIFMIEENNNKHLYVMEQHNGKDTKRLIEDLKKHIYAMDKEYLNNFYGFEKGYRILCVLEQEAVKKAIIPKLRNNNLFDHFHEYIYFKTNKELEQEFFEGWSTIDGQEKDLF